MAKIKTAFFCKNCGTQYSKWQGQCHACKEWNTIAEEILQKSKTEPWQAPKESQESIPIPIEEVSESQQERLLPKGVECQLLGNTHPLEGYGNPRGPRGPTCDLRLN